MEDGPAQPPVAQECGDVVIAAEEHFVPHGIEEDREIRAQLREYWIRIEHERRVIEVEVVFAHGR